MLNILFVCTGNTCRSPMAQGLATMLLRRRGIEANVKSAGLHAVEGAQACAHAVAAADKLGADISGHKAAQISQQLLDAADLVLCMTDRHVQVLTCSYPEISGKCHSLAAFAGMAGNVEDPFGQNLERYTQVAEQLLEIITVAIDKLGEEDCY